MKFEIKETLAQRSAIESEEPTETAHLLLVGEECVGSWGEGASRCGEDSVEIYPAVYQGERAWMIRRTWYAAHGYCGGGTEEDVVDFAAGVAMLLAHDCYGWMWADDEN